MRKVLNHALDIHGGKGICDGPHNYLQAAYQISPVSITVEGANILSRSLIVFAQGALRSHPYLYSEIKAAQNPDKNAASKRSRRLSRRIWHSRCRTSIALSSTM